MSKGLLDIFFRLSKREKIIASIVGIFVALVSMYFIVLSPILSKIESLDQEIRNQEALIKESLYILARQDTINKEIDLYDSFTEHALSQEEEVIFFLQDIEKLANKSEIYIIDIKASGSEESEGLKKYFVRVNCEGQMEQIVKFFYEVENMNKLFKIERYDIRLKTQGSSIVRCTAYISKAVLK